ncbi:NADAR domain-containing protein [Balamuthia mandrillaris]
MQHPRRQQKDRTAVTETNDFVFFWHGWPSQWHPSPFQLEGDQYTCAEQYMMCEKAKLFGDTAVREAILKAGHDPRRHKELGRKVKGFKDALWNQRREEIVFLGNLAKFRQNPELKALLLATEEKVWGIGLAAEDPRAKDPKRWLGLNLLGKALMRARQQLREEEEKEAEGEREREEGAEEEESNEATPSEPQEKPETTKKNKRKRNARV